jgi:glutathione S-transferase
MLMLEHKGVAYREVELPSGFQRPVLAALRFPARTVPALKLDGRRVQTNRHIARFLDQIQPEIPLLPRGRRDQIEDAERFADEVLQPLARRLVLAAGMRDLGSLADSGDSGRLGPILARGRRRRARIVRIAGRYAFRITPQTETLDMAALPRVLDRVDGWIEAGVLNGRGLNAADLQTAPSICLLAYRPELRPMLEPRPAWQLADRVIPERPGAEPQRIG